MLVYMSHAFQGLQENVEEVEELTRELVELNPEHTFISPINCFGFMFHDTEYEHGLRMCIDLLDRCDMMVVSGEWLNSVGVNREIDYCFQNNIPVIFI